MSTYISAITSEVVYTTIHCKIYGDKYKVVHLKGDLHGLATLG